MVLDIQNGESKFYFKKLLMLDSLYRKNANISISIPIPQIVKRKTGSFENENFASIDQSYYAYPSEDKINWKVSDSTKKFQDYKLQKATAYWAGRNWVAWFCPEIPISEGPYKFTGLPGLIMEVYDDKDNFKYKLKSFKEATLAFDTKNIVETNLGKAAVKVSLPKYQQLLLTAYNNPFSEYQTKKEGEWRLQIFNKEISTLEGLKEITKQFQNDRKKNYNPIELDKKVIFR